MYTFEFKDETYQFNECPEDDDKYIIFTCARDEEDYVIEWVDYHLNIGFDKIIICDNNLEPNKLSPILEKYIKNGTVEIFDCVGFNRPQVKLFNMFATQGHYKWCAFIDGDEFITISGHYDSIKDALEECKEDCLVMNWMVYGTNGIEKKEDKPVIERFPNPIYPSFTFKENMYLKSILRKTKNPHLVYNSPHYPSGCRSYNFGLEEVAPRHSGMYHFPPHFKKIYVRHYTCKSIEEFNAKQKRGWADCTDNILREKSHINLLNTKYEIPHTYYSEGLFTITTDCDVVQSYGKYDVYVIRGHETSGKLYSLSILVGNLFTQLTDITLVVDESINEVSFSSFLDLANRTGNRLIACKDDFELHEKIFQKYHKKWEDDFYYLELPTYY